MTIEFSPKVEVNIEASNLKKLISIVQTRPRKEITSRCFVGSSLLILEINPENFRSIAQRFAIKEQFIIASSILFI